MKKKILACLLAVGMMLQTAGNIVYAEEIQEAPVYQTVYQTAGDYIASLGTPSVGSVGGDWMALGLARSGRTVPEDYYTTVISYLQENMDENSRLHSVKSTENSRLILALTSAGYDPTSVGGYNLLTSLTDMAYVKKQGINGPIWALIAFDSHDYEIPTAPEGAEQVTRDSLIMTILAAQLSDGGWTLSGSTSDSDMTGMALQALAPYYESNPRAKAAVDTALAKVSSMQLSDGSFGSIDGSSSESCAQIIAGLTALGIDPDTDERFIKGEKSVIDALCDFAIEGGGFAHIPGGDRDGMATEQGYYALTAYVRMLEGKTSLYDMSDVTLKQETPSDETPSDGTTDTPTAEDKAEAKKVAELIDAIGTVTASSDTKIEKARKAYSKLTKEQKKLVDNYEELKTAEEELSEIEVESAEELIDAIGTVTLSSKTKINRARTAYSNLDDDEQEEVSNLELLEEAEAEYAKLLAAKNSTTTETSAPTTKKASSSRQKTSTVQNIIREEEDTQTYMEMVEEKLAGLSKDSLDGALLDALLSYDALTEEEKDSLGRESLVEDVKRYLSESIQADDLTGMQVSGCDWNVRLVVEDVLDVGQMQEMQKKVSGNQMLGVWDISLEDMTTGEKYKPAESILIKIPLSLLGDISKFDGLAVAHYTEDGEAEYLNCMVLGEYAVFNAAEFSHYAAVGYEGASPAEAANAGENHSSADMSWILWAVTGGCGMGLLAILALMLKKNKVEEA